MSPSSRRILKSISSVLLLAYLCVTLSSAQDSDFRLPTTIKPTSYVVKLHPNYPSNILDVNDFDGTVEIHAEAKDNTNTIVLHAGNNVTISKVSITNEEGTINYGEPVQSYNAITQTLRLTINGETIKRDEKIIINMEFKGKLENDMHGFYKSTYTVKNANGDDEVRMLLATQFESTNARKAFPCFDEPKFKATFQVTLTVPPGYGALCNTDALPSSTATEISFQETVIMSTYLVAFVVYEKATFGPSIVVLGTDNVKFTTWGRKTAMDEHLGDYSQTITHRILSELEEFTDIPYTKNVAMNKIDQASIPDFSSGAMENWGLVTYRETGLLFDEINSTESTRKSVAAVIAHELTHQWFGNLVTTDWWSSTWLNEGFARFFQYYILDKIYPQWRMMERLVVDQQMSVFANDAVGAGVVLTVDCNTQEEIDARFSSAAYSKGGVIVRLLSIVLGPENFQAALRDYLEDRSYDTATPEQLFALLSPHFSKEEAVEGFEFKDLIKWTLTPGYPVVNFKRNSANTVVTITQERFLLEEDTSSDIIYPVYLQWITNEGDKAEQWLLSEENSSSNALPKTNGGWYIVNNTGYFRVNYDTENWRNLYLHLSEQELSRIAPLDRATLVDNALNLARVKYMDYEAALTVVRYLKREMDYIPWDAAFTGFSFLHRMLVNVDESGSFNKFVGTLLEDVYTYLGLQDRGDHLEKIQRASTLSWACRVGLHGCREAAVDLLTAYLELGQRVPANLRSFAYCYGIKTGPEDTWLKMWQKLEINEDVSERSLLITALGCSKSYSTLYMYLQQSLSGDVIRQQDASSVFSAVYTNPEGVDVALDFLVENFARIEKTYVSMNALNNVVTGVAGYLTKPEQRAKMAKLVEDNPRTLETIGKSALATIDTNLKWLDKYRNEVLTTIESILAKENAKQLLW